MDPVPPRKPRRGRRVDRGHGGGYTTPQAIFARAQRDAQIAELVLAGLRNREIMARLNIRDGALVSSAWQRVIETVRAPPSLRAELREWQLKSGLRYERNWRRLEIAHERLERLMSGAMRVAQAMMDGGYTLERLNAERQTEFVTIEGGLDPLIANELAKAYSQHLCAIISGQNATQASYEKLFGLQTPTAVRTDGRLEVSGPHGGPIVTVKLEDVDAALAAAADNVAAAANDGTAAA